MLDRDAGLFRLAPAGVTVPAARRYLPGTMVLETSWGTRGGWIIVRDVLLIGPWHHDARPLAARTAARRPTTTPTTSCCAPSAASTARCRSSLDCEPVFDYGRVRAALGVRRRRTTTRRSRAPTASDVELRLTTDLQPRHRGPARHRAPPDEGGRDASSARCPGASTRRRARYDDAYARLVVDRAPLAALARPRRVPRPPVARGPAAQRADAQGPDLRADRRDRRRRHHLAARDARRRAQLGLPLHLDPRLDVRALGPLHARLRLGGERLLLLRRRRRRGRARAGCRSCTASTARAELPERDARPPVGLRERAPRAGRQRRARPAPARRVGRGARLGLPAHASRDHLPERVWPMLVRQVEAALAHWREPDRGIWEVRGEPQALHLVEAHVLGGARPRRAAGRAARGLGPRRRAGAPSADEIHADICANALDERGVFTQHYDTDGARRLGAADAAGALPARPTTRASARRCWRSPTS